MEQQGFDRVFLQEVMVPHWVRGAKEVAYIQNGKQKTNVPIAALGGSVATAAKGVQAQVIEVKSFPELRALGVEKVKGKIVFFNRPMDPTKTSTLRPTAGRSISGPTALRKPPGSVLWGPLFGRWGWRKTTIHIRVAPAMAPAFRSYQRPPSAPTGRISSANH
jgi:hypothetical protein